MFVDGLAFVVVCGMRLAIGAGKGLRGFVGFETQVADFVVVGLGFVAEAGVAEHEVVVCLQIFRINREGFLKFFHSISVALLEEEDAAKLVMDDAIARVLSENQAQGLGRFVVFSFGLQDAGVEIVGAREFWLEG